jgi:hypothetical protein
MIKMEYKTKEKTDKIEVKKDQVENMKLAGWTIAKKVKK